MGRLIVILAVALAGSGPKAGFAAVREEATATAAATAAEGRDGVTAKSAAGTLNTPTGDDEDGFQRAILTLSGASCMEDLDEEAIESYTQRRANPLDLNAAGIGRLKSSGLLSQYQCASIIDYRQRYGDILSFSELAMVDGVDQKTADALKYFIVLRTCGAPAERGRKSSRHSVMTRAAGRHKGDDPEYCGGLKYAGEISDFLEIRYSNRTTYDEPEIHPGTFGVAYYGKRRLETAIIGDYNLRFGQGLLQWSGTTMSGVSSAAAMKKSGSGVSPTGSFSGGRRGAAAAVDLGRGWGVSAALSLPGIRERMDGAAAPIGISPIAHASYTCSVASLGTTAYFEWLPTSAAYGASVDWNAGIPDLNFYGEIAWSGKTSVTKENQIVSSGAPALITGVAWVPSYGQKYALAVRYYPTDYNGERAAALRSSTKVADEHAFSAAATLKWLNFTLDYVYHPSSSTTQLKYLLQYNPEIKKGGFTINPTLRYSGRLKSPSDLRHDLRADLALGWRDITVKGRYNAVLYRNFAWLWYTEASYRNKFSVTARWTLFKIDDWDDRIYCYERDNPGNFTVPAFYGRGWEIYTLASYRLQKGRLRHDFGFKATYRAYPWNLTDKAPTLEIKLQYSVIF